jgi:hypothetical protein
MSVHRVHDNDMSPSVVMRDHDHMSMNGPMMSDYAPLDDGVLSRSRYSRSQHNRAESDESHSAS